MLVADTLTHRPFKGFVRHPHDFSTSRSGLLDDTGVCLSDHIVSDPGSSQFFSCPQVRPQVALELRGVQQGIIAVFKAITGQLIESLVEPQDLFFGYTGTSGVLSSLEQPRRWHIPGTRKIRQITTGHQLVKHLAHLGGDVDVDRGPRDRLIDLAHPRGHLVEHPLETLGRSLAGPEVLLKASGELLFGLHGPLAVFRASPLLGCQDVIVGDTTAKLRVNRAVEETPPGNVRQLMGTRGEIGVLQARDDRFAILLEIDESLGLTFALEQREALGLDGGLEVVCEIQGVDCFVNSVPNKFV